MKCRVVTGVESFLGTEKDLAVFAAGSLIVDVSNGVHYYAVDHSPSYVWNSATWEISEALLPHVETVLAGPQMWNSTPTISRAIEIRDGVVLTPSILSFQHRDNAYRHSVRIDSTEHSQ